METNDRPPDGHLVAHGSLDRLQLAEALQRNQEKVRYYPGVVFLEFSRALDALGWAATRTAEATSDFAAVMDEPILPAIKGRYQLVLALLLIFLYLAIHLLR